MQWRLAKPFWFQPGTTKSILTLLTLMGPACVFCLYSYQHEWDPLHHKYAHFSESERLGMLEASKNMFQFGYDNYMKYAFPEDELDPIHCKGRGPDYEKPDNININDVLGDYSLTLVESLGTLADENQKSFFLRVLGGLLSAHLIIVDPRNTLGNMSFPEYDNELLSLAHDLASRLLPAFSDTATGIPFPRVTLDKGIPWNTLNETCTSGAGTLVLEFGVLSRLLNDPVYESVSRQAVNKLWRLRSNVTGNIINIQTGEWLGLMSGLGAGIDSYFEYLLKAYILFGDVNDLKKFNESYETIKFHMRRGRPQCNYGSGNIPLYVNVNMKTGETVNTWIDALQAAWSAVQLFDEANPVNKEQARYIFTTEGHLLPLNMNFHRRPWEEEWQIEPKVAERKSTARSEKRQKAKEKRINQAENKPVVTEAMANVSHCDKLIPDRTYNLPILSKYLRQLEVAVGLTDGSN
ncbi:alpha-1,2-Mannosidase [Elysia marginata]|uniref:alpha-1,2-Mannosidase n=1 Tax=Elysia marginata TaxID=1093978 RepID=A0AAV4FKH8_9GAST|nr:alpha-1,2-Mannosidase [Elysia marginata]